METVGKLDKESGVPLYRQLKHILERRIRQGGYAPGQQLPTEESLCCEYGVSRITVRHALRELVVQGLVFRKPGNGTFVKHCLPGAASLRASVPEEQWVGLMNKAFQICKDRQQVEEFQTEVQVLGRPQLHSRIVSAVGEGKAPDLALIDWVWLTEFADLQYLIPLDRLAPEWVADLKSDFYPQVFKNNRYRGHLYGVQPEANVSLLWYRKDWLESEGLSHPRTWEQLLAVARHFKERRVRERYGLSQFPIAFPGGPSAGESTTYILTGLIYSAGGELSRGGKIILDEGARLALQFLFDLVHEHGFASQSVSSYSFNDVPRLFASGAVALAFGGSYQKALIQEGTGWDDDAFRERVGFVHIPAGPQGKPAAVAGGLVYVLFRQSAHSVAALEILKLLAAPRLMADFCRRTGRKPTRRSVVRALNPESDWFIYETSKLLDTAQVRPMVPQYSRVSTQLQEMVARVLERRQSVGASMVHAKTIVDSLR